MIPTSSTNVHHADSPPPRLVPLSRFAPLAIALSSAFFIAIGCNAVPNLPTPNGNGASPSLVPGAPLSAPDTLEGDAAPDVARDIEEADVVKIVGDKLFALNRFKGLLIVDVTDPDAPALIGRLDLRGRGVEMYVVGSRAHVLLSADFYYAYDSMPMIDAPNGMMMSIGAPIPPQPDFDGSQLAVVDVTDPAAPKLDGKINLVGFANESRRVGDIIYVIGSNFGPFFGGPMEENAGEGFVASINVADPENIIAVERKNLTGDTLTMHVSKTEIFAASRSYDFDHNETLTNMQIVDISDPAGAILLRGAFPVPGSIRNRFYMDAFHGVFRIATESFGFGFREVRLFTYDLANLDDVQPLGRVEIIRDEGLEAVRFDGDRGYVVTFLRVDPLFVLDLSDPANPAVTGHLEVPGFSTHIEPRGDRHIAVGIDDTN
ncbi:MAG: beta-propeller domain-containing protein, partial [Phycisphaerae bacterium]